MNKEEFIKSVTNVFKDIDSNWINQIELYKVFLREYNKKVNLTRLDDEAKIYGSYFYESIIPYKTVDFSKINSLLDIGSGSGIPGIVLKILYPHINLTIIESNNKKTIFLNELIKELDLKNVKVITKRAEIIRPNEREMFDLVTSRAVASIKVMLELSTPYAKVDGQIIVPKSVNYKNETNGLNQLMSALDVSKEILTFTSLNDVVHNVLIFKKNKKTNHVYPREWTKIIKNA